MGDLGPGLGDASSQVVSDVACTCMYVHVWIHVVVLVNDKGADMMCWYMMKSEIVSATQYYAWDICA